MRTGKERDLKGELVEDGKSGREGISKDDLASEGSATT